MDIVKLEKRLIIFSLILSFIIVIGLYYEAGHEIPSLTKENAVVSEAINQNTSLKNYFDKNHIKYVLYKRGQIYIKYNNTNEEECWTANPVIAALSPNDKGNYLIVNQNGKLIYHGTVLFEKFSKEGYFSEIETDIKKCFSKIQVKQANVETWNNINNK